MIRTNASTVSFGGGGTYENDLKKHWYRETNLGRGMITCGAVEVRENIQYLKYWNG